ncbi:MAG: response regulator transcription factor [Methylotetracoccus sp.]
MRLLLVEDDESLADGLTVLLVRSGYAVTRAATGETADHLLRTENFDIVLLDLGLPDIDGEELLLRLRRRKDPVGVMILTARDAVDDRVRGLERGADDYLAKPFDLRELEARLRALIRRRYGSFGNTVSIGYLTVDLGACRVYAGVEPIALSAREYGLLEALLTPPGAVASKERIANRLSVDGESPTDNAIEILVCRLRRRLAPHGVRIRVIRGLGYMLESNGNG